MMDIVYNVPVNLVPAYRGQAVIVRSEHPADLVKALPDNDLDNLVGVQLLSMTADVEVMADWGYAIPVELVMSDPVTEFHLLYRHAKLLDKHPVRVSIPVVPWFGKAVKVANSLQFTVKLEMGQPETAVVDEMLSALDFYLHSSSVSQPVEFFHSSLASFYDRDPVTLWAVQEEDPSYIRYVTEDGRETIARRLVDNAPTGDPDFFSYDLWQSLLAEGSECCSCEFFENCGGYFKWPRADYKCDGVKAVFSTLRDAAGELRQDLETLEEIRAEATR
jgi:hypothetical protein